MLSRRECDQLETENIGVETFHFLSLETFSLIHFVRQILAEIGQIDKVNYVNYVN